MKSLAPVNIFAFLGILISPLGILYLVLFQVISLQVPLNFIFQKMLTIYNRLGHLTSCNQVFDRMIDSFECRGPELRPQTFLEI